MSGVPFAHNNLSCLGIITGVIADLVAQRAQLRAPSAPDQHEYGQPVAGDSRDPMPRLGHPRQPADPGVAGATSNHSSPWSCPRVRADRSDPSRARPGATAEQKAIGAQACRTILTALDVEPGKPLVLPGAPKPHPLSGITLDQALDLAIARLTMTANARGAPTVAQANTTPLVPSCRSSHRNPNVGDHRPPLVPPATAKAPIAKCCVALVHRTAGPTRAPTFDAASRIGFCLRTEEDQRR